MHISTENIYKIVSDRANTAIVVKYDVACRLSISIFTVDLEIF